jgi:hypothetical protein
MIDETLTTDGQSAETTFAAGDVFIGVDLTDANIDVAVELQRLLPSGVWRRVERLRTDGNASSMILSVADAAISYRFKVSGLEYGSVRVYAAAG